MNPSSKGTFSLRRFDEKQCIFVHVPKAAGTSVSLGLFGDLTHHYTAWQYRVIYGRRAFNRYFKFAFVRNPWDRLYSAFSYLRAGGWNAEDREFFDNNLSGLSGFEEFVSCWLSPANLDSHVHFQPQHTFVCDSSGRVLIDYLGYFETLADDYNYVTQFVVPMSELPKVNASPRSDYRTVYSSESRRRVNELYERDVALFGYDFEGIRSRKAIENGRLL